MIKKDGPFGSVTITDAPVEYRYVRVECPECALKDARIKELEKESKLHLESANSMKSAWNAACDDISKLQSRIAKMEKVVEAAKIYASMSDHAQYCGLTPFVPYEMVKGCTCGVDKLRAALAALKEG